MTQDLYASDLTELPKGPLSYRALRIYGALVSRGSIIELNPSPWMLSEESGIGGGGTYYNTILSVFQITSALALSKHSLVEELIKEYPRDSSQKKHWFDRLIDDRVLEGVQSLDLGCGLIPTASRALRALGAVVYTVDLEPSDKFQIEGKWINSSYAQQERDCHIVMDFTKPNARERILAATQGRLFDHISAVHIYDGDPNREMIAALLKPNGWYLKMYDLFIKPDAGNSSSPDRPAVRPASAKAPEA